MKCHHTRVTALSSVSLDYPIKIVLIVRRGLEWACCFLLCYWQCDIRSVVILYNRLIALMNITMGM